MTEPTILDAGQLKLEDLDRYDDSDIETGLEQSGLEAATTRYRLVEIPVENIAETQWFPNSALRPNPRMVEVLRSGRRLPPVIVLGTKDGSHFGLIDGVNRTFAHWTEGLATIRAYEAIRPEATLDSARITQPGA